MWIFFSLILIIVLVGVVWLYRRYPGPRTSLAVKVVSAYAWLTSFSIIALVPVDVWATIGKKNAEPISVMWKISYWSTQVLTWLVIPLFQGYVEAGDFTFLGRVRSSIKDNLLFYFVMGGLGGIGLLIVIVTGHLRMGTLPGFCIALANTFGLLVVVLLLGYGLVAVPKYVWQRSNPEIRLKWCLHRVGVLAGKLEDAIAELDRVCLVVQATKQQISKRDPLRPFIDDIQEEMHASAPKELCQTRPVHDEFNDLSADDLEYATDIRQLASLRKRVQNAMDGFEGAKAQYMVRVTRAFELSDICLKRQSGYSTEQDPLGQSWLHSAYWQFRCVLKPVARRVLAVLLAALSVIVVWSEVTIALERKPDLSPFSLLIRDTKKEWPVYLVVLFPLAYMSFCTYHSLFSLGALKFYQLIPGATPPFSLLLNGALLCRFAAPLAYNFLHIIRMNRSFNGRTTVFTKQMGAMKVVPFFGKNFNTLLPIFLLVHCLLILCDVWNRVASLVLPARLRFALEITDDETLERGRTLVRKEQEAVQAGRPMGTPLGVDGLGGSTSSVGNTGLGEIPGSPDGSPQRNKGLFASLIDARRPTSSPLVSGGKLDSIFTDITGRQRHVPLDTSPRRADRRSERSSKIEMSGKGS
ncbi:hypothetical protein BSKO_00797 [Bryopsis sp. KO-2023]|nr:hypothetical protein BSKO_00797 [Bryopsis sp. KO-2023]